MADVDVVIIGAGLSGIGAACHLERNNPSKRYLILESRAAMGGTWDLFRYPGIRSDSDMHTLGYAFKPWGDKKAIADGDDILSYIRETAHQYGVDSKVRYGQKVVAAAWDSARPCWTLTIDCADGGTTSLVCRFVYSCTGYYNYDAGHMPDFDGVDDFQGRLVHPQHWPQDLDYRDRQVVVIGSGATAITLVPAMAKTAAKVTMLQRSPTYVVSQPAVDTSAERLRRWLPAVAAYSLTRWKNVTLQAITFYFSRRYPELVKRLLRKWVGLQLGDKFDLDRHFSPRYNPWDQRLCVAPDGDLFRALRRGAAAIVTDRISAFTAKGIQLESGEHLDADIVVSATGLEMLPFGGIEFTVDDRVMPIPETLAYKGMMLSGLPNLAVAVGYTNASWTLKCDLTSDYVCRLLSYMDRRGYSHCVAMHRDGDVASTPFLDFSSGYITRAVDRFPRQGARSPWKLRQNYLLDLLGLRFASLKDSAIEFHRAPGSDG